ncbi:MAG: hypothetical protein Q7T86_13675 [Hyphomicrobiaceae bacterium]|nr:hypothetical protein [Hyphomicrobiaceae bacterium]
MSFDPFALIELWIVLAFAAAWGVLEWQGRRLDRLREARERAADDKTPQTATTHSIQETHDSHGARPPPG